MKNWLRLQALLFTRMFADEVLESSSEASSVSSIEEFCESSSLSADDSFAASSPSSTRNQQTRRGRRGRGRGRRTASPQDYRNIPPPQ